jgi:hypothetical protein
MDLDALVAEVDGQLRARVVPGRAEHEKAYLKSGIAHYGVPVPAIRAVANGVRKRHPDLSHDELVDVVEALWSAPAIGWVLRDTARKRPDMVFGWLLPRAGRASGVALREACKPLSAEQRAAIDAARRG